MQVDRPTPNRPAVDMVVFLRQYISISYHIDVAELLDRLPLEIVERCFLALPFRDRLNVSHVCRKWRRVALRIPRLWSTLEFHHDARDGAIFAELLARSASAPLDAVWNWDMFREQGLGQLVANMARVRSIHVGVRYDHQGRLYRDVTNDAFPVLPAPRLERVRFASERCLTVRPAWSGDGAPRLREMLLQGFRLDPACQPFRALRRFRGRLVRLQHGMFQDLRRFLTLCPTLEHLELLGASDAYLPWLPIGANRALESYVLSEATGNIEYGLVRGWQGPLPRQMRLSHAADFESMFAFYMGHMTEPFGISCASTAIYHQPPLRGNPPLEFLTTMTSATGTKLEFDTTNRAAYVNCLADALPRLSTLARLECSVEIFDTLLRRSPTFLALETLALVPGGARKFADLNYCHFQRLGTLHAPALRVLTIDTLQLRVAADLPLTALHWCTRALPRTMDAWLRFDREKLVAVRVLVAERSSYRFKDEEIEALLEHTEQVCLLRRPVASLEVDQADH